MTSKTKFGIGAAFAGALALAVMGGAPQPAHAASKTENFLRRQRHQRQQEAQEVSQGLSLSSASVDAGVVRLLCREVSQLQSGNRLLPDLFRTLSLLPLM